MWLPSVHRELNGGNLDAAIVGVALEGDHVAHLEAAVDRAEDVHFGAVLVVRALHLGHLVGNG